MDKIQQLYERMCVGCEREKYCHEQCEHCEEFENTYKELEGESIMELNKKLFKLLLKLGVTPDLDGFDYILYACKSTTKGMKLLTEIGKAFNTTDSKVERAIRFIVEDKIKKNKLYKKLFFDMKKLTVTQFIAILRKDIEYGIVDEVLDEVNNNE